MKTLCNHLEIILLTFFALFEKNFKKVENTRWTKRKSQTCCGNQNYIKTDKAHKLIDIFTLKNATEHDSKMLNILRIEKKEGHFFLSNNSYTHNTQEKTIKKYKISNPIREKGNKNHLLVEISKIKAPITFLYGFHETAYKKLFIFYRRVSPPL
ncbi:hypothetical protein [Aquimarina sp. RZ0]|uniref:hypothetical protein n=1 Tax=Aquimarina sp. RZ0 TaxID=2607730 RepID=UPI0011F235C6|nr:hypothetical protein [Aquimarina sp. RZ0]KAA1247099.1 hypothetical protein F0000_05295 [Aquimarina sp. RZ0]